MLVLSINLFVGTGLAQQIKVVSRNANIAVVQPQHSEPLYEIWSVRPFKRRCILALKKWTWQETIPTISADGNLVIFRTGLDTLEVFETRTGKLWKKIKCPESSTVPVFSPDGKILVAKTIKGLYFWNLHDGRLLFSKPLPQLPYIQNSMNDLVEFSPDGKSVAVVIQSKYTSTIHRFDVGAKRFGVRYDTHSEDGRPLAMKFSPDSQRLLVSSYWNISGGAYDQIFMFDVKSAQVLWKWNNRSIHPEEYDTANFLNLVDWADDGKRVAVGNHAKLQIRNAKSGNLLIRREFDFEKNKRQPTLQQQRRFHPQLNIR